MTDRDEFYVGYLDPAPEGLSAWLHRRVLGLILVGLGIALLWQGGHAVLPRATFEFGDVREFEGVVLLEPTPSLLVSRPAGSDGEPYSRYAVVAFGKMGAQGELAPFEGRRVRLRGTLVYRGERTLIELAEGELEDLSAGDTTGSVSEALGSFTLRGEIVDSKCFLGVMNPGSLKPHKSCAIRCISGGVPPMLVVRDPQGRAAQLILVGAEGEPLGDDVLELVAEPVEISGAVSRTDDLLVLRADPSDIRRLP